MRTLRKGQITALWYLMMPLLSACSTAPNLNIIHDVDPVAILSPAYVENDNTLNIHNQAIGEGAKAGAATGAVAGAAYGLACGPFFILCSPLLAATGAVIGAGTGAVIGATPRLESQKAEQANVSISEYLGRHNPQDELLATVIDRAKKRW